MVVAATQWSDGVGALLIVVGMYFVATGAPAVPRSSSTIGLIVNIIEQHPRVGFGFLLIVIGGIFLAFELPDVFI